MPHRTSITLSVTVCLCLLTGSELLAVPAFPGAVGEGMNASGGRGGDVYHVTNLNSSGLGSFAYGATTGSGPRTIVFDVNGTITLTNNLHITRSNLTIAGQTAPGMGIVIRNWGTAITADNVIMQHLRLRPGDAAMGTDANGKFNEYSLAVDGKNIIVDHCSMSWSVSQLVTVDGSGFDNVTIQNCILGEALAQTGLYHGDPDPCYNPGGSKYHGNGLFVKPLEGDSGTSSCTAYQNLLADNTSRNPCPGAYNTSQSTLFEFTNNVIYNCRNSGYSSGAAAWVKMNYVGNYLIAGPSTTSGSKAFDANAQCNVSIYQDGNNKVDSDKDGQLDGTAMGWTSFVGTYAKLTSPVSMDPVPFEDADTAYNNVLARSGAFWWNRDVVDARIVRDANTQAGTYINSPKDRKDPNGILTDPNGYPVIPSIPRPAGWDTDGDGMPNAWESWYGTNPSVAADPNGDRDSDGYKDLEEYLVWIYDPNSIHHAGDASGNDAVGFEDLSRLAASWSGTGKTWADGDYNGNGMVDFQDLSILSSNWNWQWAGAPPQEVPEPASLALLATAGLATLIRRRRRD